MGGKLKLKLHLLLRLMLRLIPGMDTMADIMDIVIMDMDIPISTAERGGKLRLSPKLKLELIPKLIPGMDTMDTILVDIMDMDTMDTLMPDTTGVKGGIRLQYLYKCTTPLCRTFVLTKSTKDVVRFI